MAAACSRARLPCSALRLELTPPSAVQGEDWEHEDVAADDDLDMGEGEEEAEASPVRKCAGWRERACVCVWGGGG